MTKQEYMKNYTQEQLADKVIALDKENKKLYSDIYELKSKIRKDVIDFLPSEPVCIAGMLINLQIECENNPLSKMVTKEETYMRKMFDISELRQIAEHLLIYCNNQKENDNE